MNAEYQCDRERRWSCHRVITCLAEFYFKFMLVAFDRVSLADHAAVLHERSIGGHCLLNEAV
jgi:hypothetical protein